MERALLSLLAVLAVNGRTISTGEDHVSALGVYLMY